MLYNMHACNCLMHCHVYALYSTANKGYLLNHVGIISTSNLLVA